jgi:hypothetical protein
VRGAQQHVFDAVALDACDGLVVQGIILWINLRVQVLFQPLFAGRLFAVIPAKAGIQ